MRPMVIHISGAEQLPYGFEGIQSEIEYTTNRRPLPTGDYVVSHESADLIAGPSCMVLERKSLGDLYSTASHGRERFQRELARMVDEQFGYRAILIEAEWSQILNPNAYLDHATRMNIRSMMGSLIAWSTRFRVALWTLPNRYYAERFAFRMLERWHKDNAQSTDEVPVSCEVEQKQRTKSSRHARRYSKKDKL